MKKIVLIFLIGAVVASCAKKMAPTAASSSSLPNEKVVVGTNNPPAEKANEWVAAPAEIKPTATAVTTATSAAAKPSRTTGELTMEQKGQATYNAKCGRCHGLKVTTDYTADRWLTVMQVMAIKANLNDEEKQNVVAYVRANAKK
jgi:mono/diheme cytochrome c family protein